MLALVPAGLRYGTMAADALVVTPGDGTLVARMRRRGRFASPVRLAADAAGVARLAALRGRRPLALELPAGSLLERDVVLPIAAEQAPEQVLSYELDRLTPFSAADAFWCWSVLGREPALDRLTLRLGVLPRQEVAPALDLLALGRLVPDWLEVPMPGGPPAVVPMRHVQTGRARLRPTMLAGALCGALAVVAVVLPFVQQELAATDLDREIAALKPKIAEVDALRRRIASAASEGDVVAAEQARSGDALRGLAAVTDLLPDDSFLTEFTLKSGQLGLRGQSPVASRLIALLAADAAIRNPAFTAPVTRADSGRMDLFAIRADLAP